MTVTCSCLYPGAGQGVFALPCALAFIGYRVPEKAKKKKKSFLSEERKIESGPPLHPGVVLVTKPLGARVPPHFVRAQQGRPTQNIHGIYDRPGPWGVDSIEPKFKEGEEALKTDLAHCH